MLKKGIVFSLAVTVTACSFSPKPFTVNERYAEATEDVRNLFLTQPKATKKLDYYEALTRSVKYNLDYRIKLVNYALQAGQLDIAVFTMFPNINTSGSIYSRNNDLNTSGITSEGIPTGLSNSTPRTLRSARIPISWNLLDFGMGYVKAKQQSERVLISTEESRRQLQRLAQDVLVAYWSAYSAQQLMVETKEFQALLNRAKNKLTHALQDNSVPKETILNYQAALLDGSRRLIQLQYKYDRAMLDLKRLMFLPLDQKIILVPPPDFFLQTQNLNTLDFQKLDAVTLVNHPELRGQNYQERIAKFGVKTVLLQALPGITLTQAWNYNSNEFLQNKVWLDKSLDVAWNLLNLASLPTSYRTAKIQVKYEKLKLMALTMAALTETRYAFSRYQTLHNEYMIAHKQTQNSQAIYTLNRNRALASLASDQQVIMAKLRTLTTKMDEDLLMSDLSVALGQLYLSVGVDTLPEEVINQPLPVATALLKQKFILTHNANFKNFIDHTYAQLFAPANYNNASIYTLQMYGDYHLGNVKSIQRELKIQPNSSIAHTVNKGRDWYVLTYGKFDTAHQARADKKILPPKLAELSPWVRKIDGLTYLS